MTIDQLIAYISIKGFVETSEIMMGTTEYRCFQREKNHIDQRFRFQKEIKSDKISIYFESKPMMRWNLDMIGVLCDLSVDNDGILHGMIKRKA